MLNPSFNSELKSNIKYNFSATNQLSSLKATAMPERINEYTLPIFEKMIHNGELRAPDECLLSDDEIQKYSLLNKGVNNRKFEQALSQPGKKLETGLIGTLANFTGGLLTGGGDEKLDGKVPFALNFQIWSNLLETLQDSIKNKQSDEAKVISNLQVGIMKLINNRKKIEAAQEKRTISQEELYQLSFEHAKKVDNLKNGQSELFCGGYANTSVAGHTNIYEISRREDNNNFDVFLYTSAFHESTDVYSAGNKLRLVPYVRYLNVPAEVLLFKDLKSGKIYPGFIQKFIELQVLITGNSGKELSSEDVSRIFDYLESYRAPVAIHESGAITGQRAGTCVPSVTKTWIRKHSEHLGLYKQIMFHLKIMLIQASYQSLEKVLKSDTPDGEVARRLYVVLAHNILRRTAKCLEGSNGFGELISADVAFEARATAHDLLKRIAVFNADIEAENIKKHVQSNNKLAEIDRQRTARGDYSPNLTSVSSSNAFKSAALPSFEITVNTEKLHAASLLKAIEQTTTKLNTLIQGRAPNSLKAFSLQIHHLIDQIPLPKIAQKLPEKGFKVECFDADFWNSFTVAEMLVVQEQLMNIVQQYVDKSSYSEDLLTRRFATILPIYALNHFLALKIDAKNLSHCPDKQAALLSSYNIPSVLSSLELEDLQFLNLKEYNRIQESSDYFNAFKNNVSGSGSPVLFNSEISSKILKSTIEQNPSNGIYWMALLIANPELLEDATKIANFKYPDLTEQQIEAEYQAMVQAMNKYDQDFEVYQVLKPIYDEKMAEFSRACNAWLSTYKGQRPAHPNINFPNYPSKPAEPQRKVNLPIETKLTAIMENVSDYKRNIMMKKHGFTYIDNMRKTSYMVRSCLFQDKPSINDLNFIINCERMSPYTYDVISHVLGSDKNKPSDEMNKIAKDMNRPFTKTEHQHFFEKNPVTKRDSSKWGTNKAEGHALSNSPQKEDMFLRILRTLSQHEIVPGQLIYELTKEMKELKDPSLQALVFRLFFRSPIVNGKIELGAGEFIKTNKALFENTLEFVHSGLGIALKSNEGIDGARFFFDLAFLLSKFLTDANDLESAHLLNQADEIERWFKKPNLIDADIATLHFYRLLFLSLKEDLSADKQADAYSSYIKYIANPEGSKAWKSPVLHEPESSKAWKSPVLHEMATSFIYSLTTKLAPSMLSRDINETSFYDTLGRAIFANLELGSSHENWVIDRNSGYPYLTMGEWKIDLLLGKVYSPQGEIKGIAQGYPWEKQGNFKRLFSDNVKLNYTSLGKDCVGFTHPTFTGAFRLVPDGRRTTIINYKIQRQLEGHGDVWFEYCEPSSLPQFPQPLAMDHGYFAPIINYGHATLKFDGAKANGFITDLKTQEIVYTVDNHGKILETADAKGTPKENGYELDYLFSSKSAVNSPIQGLTRFDLGQNIVTYRKKNDSFFQNLNPFDTGNNVIPIDKIAFPRYLSLDNNGLMFFENEGKMLWSENREYEIPASMPDTLLGTIKNYLYLQSTKEDHKGMLLVPIQMILESGKGPRAGGTLNVVNQKPILEQNQNQKELSGLQRYVALEVNKTTIKPTSLESKLYLAYMYLSQTKYEEAVSLFRTIKQSETISPMGMEMLAMIQKLPLCEDHPDAKMVHLHALLLEISQKDREAVNKLAVYFDKQTELVKLAHFTSYMQQVLQSSNNVSQKCQMTHEEETKIVKIITKELKQNLTQLEKLPELEELNLNLNSALLVLETRHEFLLNREKDTEIVQVHTGEAFKEDEPLIWSERSSWVNYIDKPIEPKNWGYTYQTKAEKDRSKKAENFKKKNNGAFSPYDSYYSYGDCYEQAQIDYDNLKRNYDYKVMNAVSWLTGVASTTPMYQYTKPSLSMDYSKNGELFITVYDAATSGDESRKRDLIFRLSAWKQESNGKRVNPYLDCLLAILCHTGQFPKKIDFYYATPQEKFDFLINVSNSYEKVSKSIPDNILGNKNPVVNKKTANDNKLFPVVSRSPFEQKEISLTDIAYHKVALKPKFDTLEARFDKLENWKEYLVNDPNQKNAQYKDFEFKLNDGLLTEREGNYESSLENDLKILQADYDAGKSQNIDENQKTISRSDCLKLGEDITNRLRGIKEQKAKKQVELLKKANRKNDSQARREAELARVGGKVNPLMTYQDCIDCLLSNDERSYTVKNQNLNRPDLIKALADLTLEIVDLKSEEAHCLKILKLTEQIIEISNDAEKIATHRYLCQNLGNELSAKYHFDNFTEEEKIVLRVFCGQTGMIPFKKQTDLMEKMLKLDSKDHSTFKDIVIQLIMGGGKTSVMATILLFLSAKREGRLSFFLVPASLFDTVNANLGESMKKAFGKDLLSINLVRDEFTFYKLSQVHETLIRAQAKDIPTIVSATTLQGFELEMLSLSRKISDLSVNIADMEEEVKRTEEVSKIKAFEDKIAENVLALKNLSKTCALIDQIITMTQKFADSLLDEVDIILDSFQELNFVDGEKIHVEPIRNDLMLSLYTAMIDKSLIVNTLDGNPSVAEVVRLATNQQSLLNSEKYLQHVTPVLAKHFSTKFKEISSKLGSFTHSYIRYASGQIPDDLEKFVCNENLKLTEEEAQKFAHKHTHSFSVLKEDLKFLEWLRALHNPVAKLEQEIKMKKNDLNGREDKSGELKTLKSELEKALKNKVTADLIAQSKHLLVDLAKTTLSKISSRNYGETPDLESPGKIIPFLGVNTPATTEFGYHWEAAAYQYQFGVSNKPQAEAIFEIAQIATAVANRYVEENGEDFFLTPEYTEFFEMFGVKLDEIELPGCVEKAIENVSKDPHKLLAMQHDLVAKYATYTENRLTSNGLDLTNLLASRRAMSGTPWNVEGYEEKLSRAFNPDIGTEGRILHKLAEREKEGKILEVDFAEDDVEKTFSIHDFFNQIYSNFKIQDQNNKRGLSSFRKIRGVIEAGGLFKSFGSHADVAKGWMEFLAIKQQDEMRLSDSKKTVDPAIEAVLFFHKDEGQAQPNTLYAWRKGASSPERIGSSSVEALRAKGLIPTNYVVYYDERHTTGVDILQIPEAVNLLTFDNMLLRNTTQSTMRMRQFLFEQDAYIVISKDTKTSLYNNGKTVEDLILNAAKVQSLRKTQSMVRYFSQQINHIFRTAAIKKLREKIKVLRDLTDLKKPEDRLILKEFTESVELYSQFFVTYMKEEPYLQHGALTNMKNTKEMLKELLAHKLNRFIKEVYDFDICTAVKKEATSLDRWIDESKSLPEKWKDMTGHIGVEQETEVAIQKEVAKKVNIEIEKEIEQELQRYEQPPRNSVKAEQKMTFDSFKSLVSSSQGNILASSKIISLKEQLKAYSYGFGKEKRALQDAFSDNIYGTEGYFFPCENKEIIPIFNKLQRPPKQILAIRVNEQFRWILLSEHEAQDVAKHLKECYTNPVDGLDVNNVWLIQPDASLFVKGDEMTPFPKDDEPVLNGLMEINALAGNMDYINKGRNRDEANEWFETHPKLKVHFLKLRTFRNNLQQQLLKVSVPVAIARGDDVGNGVGLIDQMSKKRRELEMTRQGNFRPSTELAAKLLNSQKLIKTLLTDFVHLLGIDQEREDTDTVTKEAFKSFKGIDKFDEADKLTSKQFASLRIFHIPFLKSYQIKWLPLDMVQYLMHAEQICLDLTLEKGGRQYFLSEEQAMRLVETQRNLIPFVNPKYYKKFNENWQIQSVLPQDLIHIDPSQAHHLTEGQIKGITKEDLKNHRDFFNTLFTGFSDEQIGSFIHGDLLEVIPAKHHGLIKDAQIREITDPLLIPKLEKIAAQSGQQQGLWTSWISPSNIKHIKATQIKYLENPAQIAEVRVKQVEYLDPETQVPHISEKQVRWLKSKEQIQACPDKLVRHMLPETQIKDIEVRQVEFIAANHVKALDNKEKIQACPNSLVSHLEMNQLPDITKSQVPYLKGEPQIQAIAEQDFFNYLTAEESDGTINQIPFISDAQLKMVGKDQFKGLSTAQLLQLSKTDRWEKESLRDYLIKEQIQKFNSKELIDLLSVAQINEHLSAKQVTFLTYKLQIQACPDDLVQHLNIEQLKEIKETQVSFIKGAQQVKAIPAAPEFVKRLQKEHFEHMIPSQVPYLSADQIAKMDLEKEVKMLDRKQLTDLGDKGYPVLAREVVRDIQNDKAFHEKMKFVNPKFLNEITNVKSAEALTDAQVNAFGSSEFKKLKETHPLWGRVTSEVTEDLDAEHVDRIAVDKLKFLRKPAAIQAVSKKNIVHLTRAQLVNRNDSFLLYVIGVLTLGVAACVVSLVAYPLWIPFRFVDMVFGSNIARRYHLALGPNVYRIPHLFFVYLPAKIYKS